MNLSNIRITQSTGKTADIRVEIAAEIPNCPRITAVVEFDFEVNKQDEEDIRWYIEDYLQYPMDPAPKIAVKAEEKIRKIGLDLFDHIFGQDTAARDLWAQLRGSLNDLRIEVVAEVREANEIPWELICDPRNEMPLALVAKSFVRSQPQSSMFKLRKQKADSSPLRILLVICRPSLENDVPFRSVASRIIRGLRDSVRSEMQLDVLRPPTFSSLSEILRKRASSDKTYDIVHFDGHGVYAELERNTGLIELVAGLNPFRLGARRTGPRGYLLFEDPNSGSNVEAVSGHQVGALLAETKVAVLVLNACRSAHAEAIDEPREDGYDHNSQVRAYGSLAQEIMNHGALSVVAMRYNVYVVTAAQFVADLYSSLLNGASLGEAVSIGRKQLFYQPMREVAHDPLPLQDWVVPVVYEAMPVTFVEHSDREVEVGSLFLESSPYDGQFSSFTQLPPPPDVGFFGRDETILSIDRSFDQHNIVLLQGYAGSGKTSTAIEFTRWYNQTGVKLNSQIFTSFERYISFPSLLNQVFEVFEDILEEQGIDWLTMPTDERRWIAVRLLRKSSILWIWDNVEALAMPANELQAGWNNEELRDFVGFLSECSKGNSKFLLTSRNDEQSWLGNLPKRVRLPPMPMQERTQLARALVLRAGHKFSDSYDWRPLLRFSEGNPLTIISLIGQVLRKGLKTRQNISTFVSNLREGVSDLDGEQEVGRSSPLIASLNYGFSGTFDAEERGLISLLHLFEGRVTCDLFASLAKSVFSDLNIESDRTSELLLRASSVGLLNRITAVDFAIHPALPAFFKKLFEDCHSDLEGARDHFLNVLTDTVSNCLIRYRNGEERAVKDLVNQENNILTAARNAARNGSWLALRLHVEAILLIFDRDGRSSEAVHFLVENSKLVEELAQNGDDVGFRPWAYVLVQKFLRLGKITLAYDVQRDFIQSLGHDLEGKKRLVAVELSDFEYDADVYLADEFVLLADIQRELALVECVKNYEVGILLNEASSQAKLAAKLALRLGESFATLTFLEDFDQANRWFQYVLVNSDPEDRLTIGQALVGSGSIAHRRAENLVHKFNYLERKETRGIFEDPEYDKDELIREIEKAFVVASKAYSLATDALSSVGSFLEMADLLNKRASLAATFGAVDVAIELWREAIKRYDSANEIEIAAEVRLQVGYLYRRSNRNELAREYAKSVIDNLRNTQHDKLVIEAKRLINSIELNDGDGSVTYDQVPERAPYFPVKGEGRHVKLLRGAGYVLSFFTDFQTTAGIVYLHILYVYREGESEPIYAVTAETAMGRDYCFLCFFDGSKRGNMGDAPECRDLEAFCERALAMATEKFELAGKLEEVTVEVFISSKNEE